MRPRGRALLLIVVAVAAGLPVARVTPARGAVVAGWSSVESMLIARAGHTATALSGDGAVLFAGGADGTGRPLRSAELLVLGSGTGSGWQQVADLNEARTGHTATLLGNGKVLVVGGTGGGGDGDALASAELYDPASKTWSLTTSMPPGGCGTTCARSGHAATRLDDKVVVTGGMSQGSPTASAVVYNIGSAAWSETAAMGIARSAPTLTFVGGEALTPPVPIRALAVGGDPIPADCKPDPPEVPLPDPDDPPTAGPQADARPLGSAERYYDGKWTATPPLSTPRIEHAAVALDNHRVLVAGGTGCGPQGWEQGKPTQLSASEVYDAKADRWTPVKDMAVPRARHSATVLGNGKVLVAGGVGRDGAVLASSEIYDAGTDTWAPSGALVTARAGHTTTAAGGTIVAAAGLARHADPTVATALVEVYEGQATTQRPSVVRLEPPAGLAHQSIGITGAGFTDASTVTFGGIPAVSVKVDSPTRITAVSPPRQGTGEVAVEVTTAPGVTSRDIRASRFRYVAATGSWTPVADMASVVQGHAATVLTGPACQATPVPAHCGTVLITGSGRAQRYDPVAGAWRGARGATAQLMPGHTDTLLGNGKVLRAGITSAGDSRASLFLYDPAAEVARLMGTASATARNHHTATSLADGSVLLAGGEGPGAASSAVFADDPPRLTTVADVPAELRAGHTAVRLGGARCAGTAPASRCGHVLVVGGVKTGGRVLASAELYDPRTGPAAGVWENTAPLATPRAGHTMTPLPDGRVLVVGGSGDAGGVLASGEVYDPGTGTWSAGGSLSTARTGHSATVLSAGCASHCGKVLIAGGIGSDGQALATAELYDPSVAAATAFTPTVALRTARSGHVAVEVPGGGVLVAGGREQRAGTVEPAGTTAEVFAAVASPVITRLDPVSGPTFGGTEVTIRGSGLFAASVRFGTMPATSIRYLSDLEAVAVAPAQAQGDVTVIVDALTGASPASRHSRYTYGSGAWATAGPMSDCDDPRSELGSAVDEGVGGAAGEADETRDFIGVSTEGCSARYDHSATLLPDGRVLVAGGTPDWRHFHPLSTVSPVLASAQLYDPRTGTWRATTPMASPRARHTATLLRDGRVLVVGGDMVNHNGDGESSAEIYDYRTGTWTPTGPLNHARWAHTATLLDGPACVRSATQCGKVLVVGGTTSSPHRIPLGSVELYDPVTGTWTLADPLYACAPDDSCVSRVDHTATLLPTGEVLVAAGLGMSSSAEPACHRQPTFPVPSCLYGWVEILQSAQLWDPASGTWRPTGDLARGRAFHTATLVDREPCGATCGHVLAVGGVVSLLVADPRAFVDTTTSAELYDPAADGGKGAWRSAPSLLDHARAAHTASLLPDGTVMVVGGGPGFNEVSIAEATAAKERSAEVFDPVTGRWRRTSSLSTARGLQSATVLDGPSCQGSSPPNYCGSVLLAGGTGVRRVEAVELGVPLPTRTHPWVPVSSPAERPLSRTEVVFQPAVDPAEVYTPAPRVATVEPDVGPATGGTPVTLTGHGFLGATGVSFGGTGAPTFDVASPTMLRTVTPARAGGGAEVAVVNAGGTSATLDPEPTFTYVGAAGAVGDLVARPRSDSRIELGFTAVDDGTGSLATKYQVRLADAPILDAAAFDAASPLCGGVCKLPPAKALLVSVGGLVSGTTYHFAMRAVNALGEVGALSNPAYAITPGVAPHSAGSDPPSPLSTCATASPGPGQVGYPGGYSLIGLPSGTRVAAQSPLYGWEDQGARGTYSVLANSEAVTGGRGYWAWFACPTVVDLAPSAPSARLPLGGYRASMVGNPSSTPAVVSGQDFAARWDPEANGGAGGYRVSGYREPASLDVGEGLWVFSYRPTTVEVSG